MTRLDLSRLTPEEKDALILALLDRIAALEAKLRKPLKTPDGVVRLASPADRGSLLGMTMSQNPYRGFRFSPDVIQHAVWLYHCFSLSLRSRADPGGAEDCRQL